MMRDPIVLRLFAIVYALLAVFVAAGAAMKLSGRGGKVLPDLIARTRAWVAMVMVVTLAFAGGRIGIVVFFALISFLALREFVTATPPSRSDHRAIFWMFFIILPLQYVFVGMDWYGMYSVMIPVYALVLLPLRQVLAGDTQDFMSRSARLQWGLMLCVYFPSHAAALANLQIPGFEGKAARLLLFLMIVVQSSDVFQYVFGKWLGKRKVAPTVSPSKTWAGLIGGTAAATALGAGLWWATPFRVEQAAGLAALCVWCGFFGGLVMSAIKRDRGIKDFGSLIEGHGGVLDRIDSIVFAAPVFFHAVRHFWTV